jgi:hypothetical protein
MKKALLVTALILFISMPVFAQQYWDLKTSFQGVAVKPGDSNGMAFGGGFMVTFGVPDGSYEIGFEATKWWRSYNQFNAEVDSLREAGRIDYNTSDMAHDQEGLQFSVLGRYRLYSLTSDGLLDLYTGVGGGFYFFQERRQEARQDPTTGLWDVEKVDNYLETKGATFFILGLTGTLTGKLDYVFENRMTYVFDWNVWDDPYALSTSLGFKYNF